MCDGDDGAVVLLQVTLQPCDRFRVEVVGGLVEQEQVGLAQEQAAQCNPAPLTAGERRDLGVAGRRAQRVHRDVELAVEVPPVDRIDLVLQLGLLGEELVEVGVGLAHRVADGLEPVEQVLGAGDAVGDVAEHVLAGVEYGLLGQETDAEAGRDPALARVAVVLAGDDPEQARLARTVVPEHADLGRGIHRDVDATQDLLVGGMHPPEISHGEDELVRHEATTLGQAARDCGA